MDRPRVTEPGVENTLIAMLLGFFGVTALILLLPKTVKYMIRKFLLGIVGEIVAVVLTGLLTEKVVDLLGHEAKDGQATRQAPTPVMKSERF
jgi:hypothetical protein